MIYRLFNVFKMPLTLPRVSLRLLLRACKRATRISGSTVLWPQLQYFDEWRETVKLRLWVFRFDGAAETASSGEFTRDDSPHWSA